VLEIAAKVEPFENERGFECCEQADRRQKVDGKTEGLACIGLTPPHNRRTLCFTMQRGSAFFEFRRDKSVQLSAVQRCNKSVAVADWPEQMLNDTKPSDQPCHE
jgi:hypothetical protein